jgi:AGCS family alanine or glycine:cation symporter
LTAYAFESSLGTAGAAVVGLGLSLFAFSTIIAWSYYGDRSAHFLFGENAVRPYRVIFTFLVLVGAAVPLQLVWNIADITNILMALPNLLSLALLAGLVQRLKNAYFYGQQRKGEQ